ncbi:MAG TPA: oligopeptide/dipeptide ABC transporter ATP-binding protein [Steroidobacteraceae bacterium]|nr:oligopeptide/dipeptide ABC transporter ATP-binding protein [Steroidobacteraceae bacterium]
MTEALLDLREISVEFPVGRRSRLRALDQVSVAVAARETLGVVGESGCGKSTLGRVIVGLNRPTAGEVHFQGVRLDALPAKEFRRWRRDLQIVFQDPFTSLDPRMTIAASVAEPLASFCPELGRAGIAARTAAMLERVGLGSSLHERYPHELSGGQCQRAAIARALILQPALVVCDEAVSALDVSVQAQIVRLLAELKRDMGVGLVFISHNLAVVRLLSERVLVLYLGRMMELAPRERLFAAALHPYTRALLASVPIPDPGREKAREQPVLGSELPSPLRPPSGCVFRTRCPLAIDRCADERPRFEEAAPGHWVACHRWRDAN